MASSLNMVFYCLAVFIGLNQSIHIKQSFVHFNLNPSDFLSFHMKNSSSSYSHLCLKGDWLYASGVDYVFKLNSSNVTNNYANTFFKFINTTFKLNSKTPLIIVNKSHSKAFNNASIDHLKSSSNHIKFLAYRLKQKDLIICGTNLGKPHIYDLNDKDLSYQFEHDGTFLCPALEDHNNLALIVNSETTVDLNRKESFRLNNVMYSAFWITNEPSELHGIFSRYGIFRKSIDINDNFARTLYSPFWLWEPKFVSILDDKEFVIFIFNEISIEDFILKNPTFVIDLSNQTRSLRDLTDITLKKQLKTVTRVARVCKSDNGFNRLFSRHQSDSIYQNIWTTFRKIKLECNFNETRISVDLNDLQVTREINVNGLDILIAIYHHHDLITLSKISILCEFDLNQIRNALKAKIARNRSNSRQLYQKDLSCDQQSNHLSSLNQQDYYDEDLFENDSEKNDDSNNDDHSKVNQEDLIRNYYRFLGENTILNQIVVGQSKLVIPHEIKSIEIGSETAKNQLELFVSTSKSKIIKLLRNKMDSNYDLAYDLNILDLDDDWISQLVYNKPMETIYAASNSRIMQIELKNFSRIQSNDDSYDEIELNGRLNRTIKLRCHESNVNYIHESDLDLSLFRSRFRWYKNGRLISIGDELKLAMNQKEELGVYECRISLNENKIKTKRFNLKSSGDSNEADLVEMLKELRLKINLLESKLNEFNEFKDKFNCN